jgi:hypothetical protein
MVKALPKGYRMSLEKKIKAMLAERATLPISNMDNGDRKEVNQGSSQDPAVTELDKNNSGTSAAAPIAPAESAASIKMKADAAAIAAVKTQAQEAASEAVTAETLKADVAAIFEGQAGLAEGFVEKATGLFEAAVVARVNSEVTKAVEKLTESNTAELEAAKVKLSEEVDAYMTYVVETWMKENQVGVDAGLRTEVAESFIAGLKDLFVENYIEVPEDQVNVVESLSTDLEASKSRLNEEIEKSIALSDKIVQLEKQAVLESASKGLVATDAERLVKLVEGVEFDSKEMFADKVTVIKEAHFKTASKKSAETLLAEQADGTNATTQVVESNVQRYVDAINRRAKF